MFEKIENSRTDQMCQHGMVLNVSHGMITLCFPLKARDGVAYTESAVREAMSRARGIPFLGVDNKPIGFVGDVSGVRYTVGESYITCEIPVTIFNTAISMSHAITEQEDDGIRIVDFELGSVYVDK